MIEMADKKLKIMTVPFRGGAITAVEPAMLPAGSYSMIQNMRQIHSGKDKGAFIKRPGQAKLHTTTEGELHVKTLYQFCKGKKTERHFYAQMSDDDVLEATNAPPTVTDGVFGPEVFSGSANSLPASWSTIDDMLLFSNGVDQHQIYTGTATPVWKFVVFKGAAAPAAIPAIGEEYTEQVTDGLTTTAAILDSLGDLVADYDCIFIMTPVPVDTFTWTMKAVNTTASVAAIKYKKNDNTWAAVSGFQDNTIVSSCTLGQSGTMTFTLPTEPTDSMPSYMYGANGYWYQIYLSSGDLDSEVEVSAVTFETDWQSIVNIWDGVPVDAIEAQFYDQSATVYKTYASGAITVSEATASDEIYFSSFDPIVGFYVDVGATPNTTASTTINAVSVSDGTSTGWVSVGTITDGTAGLSKSGFVTFGRQATAKPVQHNNTGYYAYWYKFTVDQTLSASLSIAIQTIPYFDIAELGKGRCNCAWKDRSALTFDRHPSYVYITAAGNAQILNGDDFSILQAGDGRANAVVCMRKFYNEMMVWQVEQGEEGGCLTLFEGYDPETFGKLVLSSKLGTMNAKSVAVVDGVMTSTATEETVKTLAFCLSRYGIYVTDGRTCSMISDDIQNYFDPTETECIRRGYENRMWLAYDSAHDVIRVGLVSGSSATYPNVLPVYDLKDKTWSFDVVQQGADCMTEIEAASGDIPILQVAGSRNVGGWILRLNTGTADITWAIDSYAMMEIDGQGMIINLRELILRMKVQSAGNVTLTPYLNSIAQTAKTLSMTAEIATQILRRHRFPLNLIGQHISLKFQNSSTTESMQLIDMWPRLIAYENQ